MASERVRVAEALDALPALDRALESGELHFSAVREVTRIATRKTEQAWLAACRGKSLREIEELLAEREPGDTPDSPRKPDLRMRNMKFKARPATWANVQLARQKLEAERGERLDEDELLDAMAQAVLAEPHVAGTSAGPSRSRAHTQVAVTICRDCAVARQTAANTQVALRPDEVEYALCDAEWIDIEGRTRARQDITPAVRKVVKLRDGNRCRVPGCRAAWNLDIHHIVLRAHGGTHDPENLLLLCSGHHKARHREELSITGTALTAVFTWADPARNDASPHVDAMDATSHVEDGDEIETTFHVEDGDEIGTTFHVKDGDEIGTTSHVEDDAAAGLTSHVGYRHAADAGSFLHDAAEAETTFHVGDRGAAGANTFVHDGAATETTSHVEDRVAVEATCRVGAAAGTETTSHVGSDVRADALRALETLGFTRRESRAAVDHALGSGPFTNLETLIRAALRQFRPGS